MSLIASKMIIFGRDSKSSFLMLLSLERENTRSWTSSAPKEASQGTIQTLGIACMGLMLTLSCLA